MQAILNTIFGTLCYLCNNDVSLSRMSYRLVDILSTYPEIGEINEILYKNVSFDLLSGKIL